MSRSETNPDAASETDDEHVDVEPPAAVPANEAVTMRSPQGRWVLAATVGASSMAFLDGTVVNVALPEIGRDLDASLAGLQWVLNGYMLATASLILLGGSLGDMFGRRAVFLTGVVVFAAASVACGMATTAGLLVAARVVQGVGGALLTPASLAILEASFRRDDRARAIGAWSGLSGVAGAIGPFLGGWLVDAASWRWVFLINVPLAVAVAVLTLRHVPETSDPTRSHHIDFTGAALIAASLAGLSWGLIAAGERGWADPAVALPLAAGVVGLGLFVLVELRSRFPMVPPSVFAIAQFRAANLVTVAVYAGLGVVFFLLVLQLQDVLGYSALEAGAASLPITMLMMALSSKSGQLAERHGPRVQMTVGPLLVALGLALMARIGAGDSYALDVLPPVLLVGLGLSSTVAPLTATALGAVDDRHAGVASGVNTTVARASQLAAVAAVPVAAGISGDSYLDPALFTEGFRNGMLIAAGLVSLGGVIGWLTVRNPVHAPPEAEIEVTTEVPELSPATRFHCGIGGPALDTCPRPGSVEPDAA